MDKQSEYFLRENYCKVGPTACAKEIGISYRACVIRAMRMGLGSRRTTRRNEIVGYVREWYSKKAAKECAEDLGISVQRVRSVASDIGVAGGRRSKTKYSRRVNAEFFDIWTEASAYVLGFLYADGNLQHDKITFYQKESAILWKIRESMGIKNIPHGRTEGGFILSVNNCHMADRLREIGVRAAKSTTGEMLFPDVPDCLFSHFFRGFFDGDGSVGIYGEWKNCRLSLFGPYDWLCSIRGVVHRLLPVKGGGVRKTSKKTDFSCCSWGARGDVRIIRDWMYKEATILLNRKLVILNAA